MTLEKPQAWLPTGHALEFKVAPDQDRLVLCAFIEANLASYFADISGASVAATPPEGPVVKALKIATQIADFGTQCQNKSLVCGIAPHGTAACKFWCTMLAYRTADVPDLKALVDWYEQQK